MQKVAKSILTGIIFTFVSACGATLNTGMIDYTKKELPLELKEIEKEFSVKAVSQSYVHSRMSTFISTSGTRLTKELMYAMYRHPNLPVQIVSENPDMYGQITGKSEIQAKRLSDAAFNEYINSLNPNPQQPPVQGSEFRVNTTVNSDQKNPSNAIDRNGNYVVVWQSNNQVNGSSLNDIYGQRFDSSGNPIGGEFLINTYTTGEQTNPKVAMDTNGNYVVVWQSNNQVSGSSNTDIYAQRYDSNGVKVGNEFLVNTSSTSNIQSNPVISMNNSYFAISWQSNNADDGASGYSIKAKVYNSATGSAISNEFVANSYSANDQINPTISLSSVNSNILIGWQSNGQDGSGYGVYGRRFTYNGTGIGTEFRVNTTTSSSQYDPSVAYNPNNNTFIFTWIDNVSGYSYLRTQRYDANGIAQSPEATVSSSTSYDRYNANIEIDSNGNYVVTWDYTNDGSSWGTYARRYDDLGVAQAGEFRVNSTNSGEQSGVSISMNKAGNMVISWQSAGQDGSGYGIYSQRYSTYSRTIEPAISQINSEVKVNRFTLDDQKNPSSAIDDSGNMVVVWQSDLLDTSLNGIYGQRYNASGNPVGTEFRINTYTTGEQTNPKVAMDTNGNFVVVWESLNQVSGNSSTDIYAQRYDSNGTKIGNEFLVNTLSTANTQNNPVISMNNSYFAIAWQSNNADDGASGYSIKVKTYETSTGNAVGNEFVSNSYSANDQINPTIAISPINNNLLVGWQSNGQDGSGYGIYGRRFTYNGTGIGTEFRANTTTSSSQYDPSVAYNPTNNTFIFSWVDSVSGYSYLRFQRYDANGIAQSPEATVSSSTSNDRYNTNIKIDQNGNYVISWDYTNDGSSWGTYARRYDDLGVAQAGEFRVNSTNSGEQSGVSMSMNKSGKMIFAWQSAGQDGNGYGIYANTFSTYSRTIEPVIGVLTGESRVNRFTLDDQKNPSSAIDDSGNMVVVWQSDLLDTSLNGIYGQRYDASGNPVGTEFRINTYTTGEQTNPKVAMDTNGNFVVVWESLNQVSGSSNTDVYAQRYDANGNKLGNEFLVNSGVTSNIQSNPVISMNNNYFAIAWQSNNADDGASGYSIKAKVYDSSNGSIVANEFVANSYSSNDQINPTIAISPVNSNILIGWQSNGQDTSGYGVYGRRFTYNGTGIGTEFRANTTTSSSQYDPSVAYNPNNNTFIFSWVDSVSGYSYLRFQRYDANGISQSPEATVSSSTSNDRYNTNIKIDQNGDYIISWDYTNDGSSWGTYARMYDVLGTAKAGEFRVNSTNSGEQSAVSMSMNRFGNTIFTWQSNGQDGSGYGIYAKRYDSNGVTQ